MEISLLKALLNNITLFSHLSSCDNVDSEPVQTYYRKIGDVLKVLKPILEAIVDTKIASDENFNTAFEELGQTVDELRDLFENLYPLTSKVYFVLLVESLITKIRNSGLDFFHLLESSDQFSSVELSSASLEHSIQKIKYTECEPISTTIKEALRDQEEGTVPSSESLVKIADSLNLGSNQELLIEAVALEKIKENAEQAEKNGEAEYINQMIALVTHMHDDLVSAKQSQSSNPVMIPADFCCPLSLELMTDPVIVASGQTYERAFIRKWIELGLTVCPKTRQTLAHSNLIPNYTVKALIANWCELNNVKLPDPTKSPSYNQPSPRPIQPMSPESTRSIGSPGKNIISSSGNRRDAPSPSHPRSPSEGSMSGVTGNGHGLDIGRISHLTIGDPRLANSEERSLDSDSQSSMSPSKKEFPNTSGVDEHLSEGYNSLLNAPGSGNEVSQVFNGSDASAEVAPDLPSDAPLINQPRVPELPHRTVESRTRSQTIWRRPSERFVPRIVSSPAVETRADLSGIETQVRRLVEDLKSPSIDTQRDATAEIRILARNNMDNRIVIANCGAIAVLVNLLHSADMAIQENAVTALLNLSINDNNKTAIADAQAIGPLIHVLETGSPEAKENSAATLFSLSVIEENKVTIGRSGAIRPLVELLGNGTPRGKKDAATALFNLSIFHENKARIVTAGAVRYLVDLMDPAAGMVDKAVAVLANLATIPEGRTAIGQERGIPVLVEVVELGSARGKENAAAALVHLCTNSSRFCNTVLQEGAVPPLVALSQSGTPRAKEKAQALLSYFRNQRHGRGGRG